MLVKAYSLQPKARSLWIDGPMKELEGIFQYMSGEDRVHILMELLNRTISVRLPIEQVVAI